MADFEITGAATFDASQVTTGIQETITSLSELVEAVTAAGAKTGAALNLAPLERAVQASVTALDGLLTSFERVASASSNVGGGGLDQLRAGASSARGELATVVSLLSEVNRAASGLASVDVGRIGRNLLTSIAGATTASAQALGAGRTGAGLNTQLSRAGTFALGAAEQPQASLAALENDMRQALGGERSALIRQLRNALVSGIESKNYPGLTQIPNLTIPSTGEVRYNSALTGQPQSLLGGKITDVSQVEAAAAASAVTAAKRALDATEAKALADKRLAESDIKLAEAQDAAARRARVDAELGGGTGGVFPVGTKGTAFSAAEGGFVDANGRLLTSFTAVTAASKVWSAQLERLEAEQIQASKGFTATFFSSLFGSGGSKFRGGGDGGGHGGGSGLAGIADTAAVVAKYEILGRGIQSISKFAKTSFDQFALLDEGIKAYNQVIGTADAANATFVNGLENIARNAGENVVDTLAAATKGVAAFSSAEDSASARRQVGQQFAQVATTNAVITGQKVGPAANDIIAIGTSFGIAASGLSSINDAIATAHSQFGSSTLDISNGLKLLADDGKAAGYSMNELAQVVGLDAARLAESGDEVATNLQRVFAQFQSKSGQSQLQAVGVNTLGTIKTQIEGLAAVWPNLTGKQQQNIEATLGGAKAMKELLPLLNDNTDLQKAFAKSLDDSGAGANLAKAELNSLAGTLKVIGETIKNIALDIARTGIFDPLVVALELLKPALQTLDSFIQLYDRLPEAVKGGTAALIEAALAFKAFNAIKNSTNLSSVAGVFHGLRGGSDAAAGAVVGGLDVKAAQAALAEYTAAVGRATAATQAARDAAASETLTEEQLASIKKVESKASADAAAALVRLATVANGGAFTPGGAAAKEEQAASSIRNQRLRRYDTVEEGQANRLISYGPDGRPIGALSYNRDRAGNASVSGLYVDPAHEGQGVATALHKELDARFAGKTIDHGPQAVAGAEAKLGPQLTQANHIWGAQLGEDAAASFTAQAKHDFNNLPNLPSAGLGGRELHPLLAARDAFNTAKVGIQGSETLNSSVTSGLKSVSEGIKSGAAKLGQGLQSNLGTIGVALIGAQLISSASSATKNIIAASDAASQLIGARLYGTTSTALAQQANDLKTAAAAARHSSSGIIGSTINAALGDPTGQESKLATQQATILAANAKKLADIEAKQANSTDTRELSSSIDLSSTQALTTSLKTLADSGQGAQQQLDALNGALLRVATSGGQATSRTLTPLAAQAAGINAASALAANIEQSKQLYGDVGNVAGTNVVSQSLSGIGGLFTGHLHALSSGAAGLSSGDAKAALKALNGIDVGALTNKVGGTITAGLQTGGGILTPDLEKEVIALGVKQMQDAIPNFKGLSANVQKTLTTGFQATIKSEINTATGAGGAKVDAITLANSATNAATLAQAAGAAAGVKAALAGGNQQLVQTGTTLRDLLASRNDLIKTAIASGLDPVAALAQYNAQVDAAQLSDVQAKIADAASKAGVQTANVSPYDATAQIASQIQGNIKQLEAGATGAQADQLNASNTTLFAQYRQAQLADAQSARKATVDSRDTIGQANADYQNATDLVKAITASGVTSGKAYTDALAQQAAAAVAVQQDNVAKQNARLGANAISNDPLSNARTALQEAQNTLGADLKNTTQYYNDLKAVHEAQYQLALAQQQHASDAAKLTIDLTNPVQVAQQTTADAARKLAFDQSRGADTTKDTVDLRSAQSAEAATQFAQNLGDIKTADQLGQISHTQYIQYLKTQRDHLKAEIAGSTLTTQGRRQAIDELNSLGQDLLAANNQLIGQFNIGNIKVPTPYEVRRAIATQAVGQQYQSSSSNVTINVDGANYDQVAQLLGNYLGPVTSGQYTLSTRKA